MKRGRKSIHDRSKTFCKRLRQEDPWRVTWTNEWDAGHSLSWVTLPGPWPGSQCRDLELGLKNNGKSLKEDGQIRFALICQIKTPLASYREWIKSEEEVMIVFDKIDSSDMFKLS